jgi:formylglycine-generating enzyme required for sulfatase activity
MVAARFAVAFAALLAAGCSASEDIALPRRTVANVEAIPVRTMQLDLGSSVTMTLVRVHAGSFVMGSPRSELGREKNEGPQTRVKLTRDYWIGQTEVTQAEYWAVMGENPSVFIGDSIPVNNVSWEEATAFCEAASDQTGRTVLLPTEAQWEYACRAGTTTPWITGEDHEGIADYAWFDGNSDGSLHPVGTKKPNPWGIHDMTGNATEWCRNWYYEYPGGEVTDPTGPETGDFAVLRPGVFYLDEFMTRSAARLFWPRTAKDKYYGFRVIVEGE